MVPRSAHQNDDLLIIVRFSTLVAFLLPLSVLAAPYLVRCGCADDSIDQLKNGLTHTKLAFETLFNQAIKPPRQGDLANDTLSPCSTLASISGPVDRVGGALQKGTRPLGDEITQITDGIVAIVEVIAHKLEKDVDCTGANDKNLVCVNIRKAADGLLSASRVFSNI